MIAKEQAAVSAGQAVASKRSTTWWPLAVLVAINVLNFYDRQVAGAIVEPVRKEFHLTDTAIGLLNTLSLILYGLVGLPLGLLADRISRKKLLAAGIVVWTVFTASARWINSYSFLLISRLGVGVGEATAAPTATSWIGDLFPAERRSKPLALFMLGVPVGGALSFFFTGPIALKFGWRAAMVVAAAPALLLVPLLLMLREPARGAAEKHAPACRCWFHLGSASSSHILVDYAFRCAGKFHSVFNRIVFPCILCPDSPHERGPRRSDDGNCVCDWRGPGWFSRGNLG